MDDLDGNGVELDEMQNGTHRSYRNLREQMDGLNWQGPRSKFSSGEGGLERQTSKDECRTGGGGGWGSGDMLPRKLLILTPLKCREMHPKLINEILKYKLSVLKKRYFYPIEIDKHLFSPIIKIHHHTLISPLL